ncbi:hypothetical protein VTN96DRAFT_1275 [Rasamsonia emersonii]|uniref:WD repeat protein n=1 Tax=Rasamsonia emersonii (strain ATCC 16479 / CBS 393.64 / IMI 116815) TaxID=1408163 RepID=A0A0F4Z2Y6_RASE3|nr:WD repeat protein [Rasamsonia emersonii CBS 393.64]KKA24872.1 WD repeat protein [Rasamsonia emersonii CBS 393.64]
MSSPGESRTLASAFDSPTFGEDSSFHVEQPVGSMSISPCGRDVVLASKEGLHIIDLDSPYSPPRFLPHHTPWEVADVQWSPFAARDFWVVSTSNQKALVWNLAMKTWENSIEHVLHAHSRAITDINFSAHHPDILATCAVDSFVHCWDLRIPTKPVISFSDWFAGATQVKWNRQDPHVIASSHDKYLRIWDDRMGATPIRSIEAHSTKIYGVDWNRMRPGAVVTCSLDKTIKFWDYTAEGDVPEKQIKTPFPVWRARHTPFGWGILAMPQRGNNDLHLYSRRAPEGSNPAEGLPLVHSFPGHKGQVKEFLWRPRGAVIDGVDHREFQLVSWGADRELRLHRVDPEILRGVGYEKGKSFVPTLNVTRKGAVYKTFRDEPPDQDLGDSLYAETIISPGSRPRFSAGIGMNNVSMPYARAWSSGGNVDSRVGMQGRSYIRTDVNPIAWMRGVKISSWDVETLGDEITHVGEKFTKVVFESVDVRQRKATISLHGPWGPEGASLFLKVDIKFPIDYPRAAIPVFRIQKTASMTDELAEKLTSELRTISETYLSRKRGCLEGALRYLLGECNLEESIALVLGETTEAVKSPVNGLEDDESSDEDEEVGTFQKQDLGMSSELLRPVTANVMVPVARVCGATWSHDGRLVCFFPPKKDKSSSLFDSLGFKEMTRLSRNEKVFEGFGRLQTSSPGRQTTAGTGTGTGTMSVTDDGASDYSDDSSTASSSSSGSSDILSALPNRFQAPPPWRNVGSLGYYRTRSADNSQLSTVGGGPGTAKSMDAPHNVVSIHDLSELLPAKRELAAQYRIFGNGADVCAHNAAVAADAGYPHLAQVWGLLRLILHNQGDSRAASDAETELLARPINGSINRRDSGIDLTDDFVKKNQSPKAKPFSEARWGEHALGARWLVPALFDHFEQIGDVQMLAMLSCIFHEQCLKTPSVRKEQRREVSSNQEHSPFAVDFFPSKIAGETKSQVATPLTSVSKESPDSPAVQSPHVPTEPWNSVSTTPYSTGTTSPMVAHPSRPVSDRRSHNQSFSVSASPDHQGISRSGSGIGTALASSLSRSFTFGPSSASSPPSNNIKRKSSPNGSLNIPATGGWTGGIFSKAVSAIPDYLTTSTAVASQTHSDADSEKRNPTKQPVKVKVAFKNRNSFDSEDDLYSTFIDPKRDWLYRSYRNAYANLLFIWGLPIQRSEVLKVGGTRDQFTDITHLGRRSRQVSLALPTPKRKESASTTEVVSKTGGLDVQRHCTQCGNALQESVFSSTVAKEPNTSGKIGKSSTPILCSRCKAAQPLSTKIPCVICGETVGGMFTPCLECGHVSCFGCHQQWFSQGLASGIDDQDQVVSNGDDGSGALRAPVCPSGCGCSCSEHEVINVPMPASPRPAEQGSNNGGRHFRSKSQSQPSEAASGQHSQLVGQSEDDLESWRVSPFATLARGLGGGLSRGLHGRDDRSKPSTAAGPRAGSLGRKTALDRMETM